MNQLFKNLSGLLIFLIFSTQGFGQETTEGDLYKQIKRLDSLLFEAGFNNCDLEALSEITDETLQFYHDISGITSGKKEFIDGIRNNICSIKYKPVRKLSGDSFEVYALKRNGKIYGAVQNGTHEFYAIEKDGVKRLTSTAQFSNLWIIKNGKWILQNVLSYDHKTPKNKISKNNKAKIKALLKENKVPALAMATLKAGEIDQINVYGELYKDKPANEDAIFNVASLTKPVITMLTLKLVESGKWNLDEPLYKYYIDTDIKNDPRHKVLTTRHILSHQSGFPNWRTENKDNKLKFNFEPGKGFNYSGEGFEYLKKSIESKFGTSIEILSDSLIFQPLKMENTRFTWDETIDEENFAKWHDENGENTYSTFKNKTANAADDLLTTIEDYAKFASYVLQKIKVQDSLYTEMITRQNSEENNIAMGLGWEILPGLEEDQYAILHTGGDIGVNTLVILLPETGEGLIIFTNSDNGKNLYFPLIEDHLSLGSKITGSAS